jgi:hypothetical protein
MEIERKKANVTVLFHPADFANYSLILPLGIKN